jgi:hypothetical protein
MCSKDYSLSAYAKCHLSFMCAGQGKPYLPPIGSKVIKGSTWKPDGVIETLTGHQEGTVSTGLINGKFEVTWEDGKTAKYRGPPWQDVQLAYENGLDGTSSRKHPRLTFQPERGWRFFDNMRSIDCDKADKKAWCKMSMHATLFTREVFDSSSGEYEFNVKVLSVQGEPFTWGLVDDSAKNHANYPIGHAQQKGSIGIMAYDSRGAVVFEGQTLGNTPGVVVGDIVGVRIKDGKALFLKNGQVIHNIGVKGMFRFGVSLMKEGQSCQIVDGSLVQPDLEDDMKIDLGGMLEMFKAQAQELGAGVHGLPDIQGMDLDGLPGLLEVLKKHAEDGGGGSGIGVDLEGLQGMLRQMAGGINGDSDNELPVEPLRPDRGWTFLDNLRSVDCDGPDKKAWCTAPRTSTSVTKQAFEASADTPAEFLVKIEGMGDSPFTWGVVEVKAKDHGIYSIGQPFLSGSVGVACFGTGGNVLQGGEIRASAPGVKVGDVVGVSVSKGEASFMHNSICFHTLSLHGKFRFAVSLVTPGQVCKIVDSESNPGAQAVKKPDRPPQMDMGMGALTTMTSLTRQVWRHHALRLAH